MPIKLYDSKVSPYARKVRLAAAELDIPIEKIPLDFQKGDPQKPEYRVINPNGKVPTIDDDGVRAVRNRACGMVCELRVRGTSPSFLCARAAF